MSTSTESQSSEKQPSPDAQESSKSAALPITGQTKNSKSSRKSPGSAGRQTRRVPVPTKHNDHRLRDTRTIEARKRLGITPEKMRGVPRISHLLECAEGGVDACIGALRLSDDPDAERFLGKYDSLRTSDRNRVTIEEISIAAGVPVKNLLASALLAVEYVGTSAARMATASFSAPVIKAVGQRAINGPSPTANSKLFLSGSGFLPRPANREPGVFVNITNQNAAAARALHEANESSPPPQIESSPVKPYIPAENELRALHGELDATRMLEGPKEDSPAVEVGSVFRDSEELECIPSGK